MAGGIGRADDEMDVLHDINVTPFIDVILVLLIIFMVAAPLSTADVKVELPKVTAKAEPRPDKPIYLTLKPDLTLALNDSAVASTTLASELDRLTQADKTKTIYVRADKGVFYGDFINLMNTLRGIGYVKIGLVGLETKPDHADTASQ